MHLLRVSPVTHPANSIPNEYYRTAEEYQMALADALREEYRAIVDAGLVLQVDDPLIANYYDHAPSATIEECRIYIGSQAEVINYALRGIPEDRIRFHTCYGVNIAPRVHDLELKYFVDLLLKINASGYSIRHTCHSCSCRGFAASRGQAPGTESVDPGRAVTLH